MKTTCIFLKHKLCIKNILYRNVYSYLNRHIGEILSDCQPPKGTTYDSEPRAGKSSKIKWVKSCQISKWKDFQWGLWVLEVTYHFKAGAVNITMNFMI